jgi:hypothetical protein
MSHSLCEVIIPPRRPEHGSDYVGWSVYQVMTSLARQGDKNWWDRYIIGGRWRGEHVLAGLPKDKLAEFREELKQRHFAAEFREELEQWHFPVSSVRCGKEEEAYVDALWREFFPGAGDKCLLVAWPWSNSGEESVDVMPVGQLPMRLSAATLIVTRPDCFDKHKLWADFMLHTQVWNGCNLQATNWDGNVLKGIELAAKDYNPVTAEWLAVTVDYDDPRQML